MFEVLSIEFDALSLPSNKQGGMVRFFNPQLKLWAMFEVLSIEFDALTPSSKL